VAEAFIDYENVSRRPTATLKQFKEPNMTKREENSTAENVYSVSSSQSFTQKIVLRVRHRMYAMLGERINLDGLESVLDVGVTAERERSTANFFERLYPHKDRLTALSDQDASWMEEEYPGLTFVQGDGRGIDFPDNHFDLVFSSAVIEHVGSFENQVKFIKESLRVSKKYVFLTTPNRHHFMEFHTVLPLIHWLPKASHRALLKMLGHDMLAKEENLNLMSKGDMRKACEMLGVKNYTLFHATLMGWPSNNLLLIEKA